MRHSFFYQDEAMGERKMSAASPSAHVHPRQRTRGQAMVEMALVIGILLLIILGGLDGPRRTRRR